MQLTSLTSSSAFVAMFLFLEMAKSTLHYDQSYRGSTASPTVATMLSFEVSILAFLKPDRIRIGSDPDPDRIGSPTMSK
jgi:hypothetical protein